jgi:putative transcriptional regulator
MIKPRIGKLLRASKYKREFIIQELDISKNTLSNWIAGNTYPTIDKAFLLADLLEVNVDDLYERNKGPAD